MLVRRLAGQPSFERLFAVTAVAVTAALVASCSSSAVPASTPRNQDTRSGTTKGTSAQSGRSAPGSVASSTGATSTSTAAGGDVPTSDLAALSYQEGNGPFQAVEVIGNRVEDASWYRVGYGPFRVGIDPSPSFREALFTPSSTNEPSLVSSEGTVVPLAASPTTQADTGNGTDTPRWSPDGHWLAVPQSGNALLYDLTRPTAAPKVLAYPTSVTGELSMEAVTNNGDVVISSATEDDFVIPSSGAAPTPLTVPSVPFCCTGALALPDGGIAVNVNGGASTTVLLNANGSVTGKLNSIALSLSPDEKYVLTYRPGATSIDRTEMACELSTLKCKTVPLPELGVAQWLPNGDLEYGLNAGDPDIHKLHWWNPTTGAQDTIPAVFYKLVPQIDAVLPAPMMDAIRAAVR